MKIQTIRERLLASTMIAGVAMAAMAATPAMAQEQPEDEVESIVITGSRIPQPNLVTTSPVTQVTGEDVDVAGVTRVEDLVNQLPQAFAAQNSTVSNGATGTATVSLRNLGADRTLVLIDGRRMGYGSPNDAAADLNQIPGQLVERVEVLTGGASAVYGSDALAGVVNFIMRRNFEGVQLDAQYGFYQHNNDYDGVGNLRSVIEGRALTNPDQFQLPEDNVTDGYSREATLVIGTGTDDGRANITAYLSYRNNDYVLGAGRDYSSCSLGGQSGSNFTCGGSGTSFPGSFIHGGPGADGVYGVPDLPGPDGVLGTPDDIIDPFGLDDGVTQTIGAGGTFTPYNGNVNAYNFGPLNYFQRPDERYSFGAFAEYEINDHAEIYADIMFTDYSSVAQIAPSGVFGNTSAINCGNPFLSAQQAGVIGCTAADIAADNSVFFIPLRRNVEGGGRQDDIGYQSFRMVGGVRGPINDFWSYDVFTQYSRVELQRTYRNDFSVTRIGRALDVIIDPNTGDPACRSAVSVADGGTGIDFACAPYDIFSGAGPSQASLDYLQIPLVQTGQTTQQLVSGSVTGDLGGYGMQSPWASRGVQVAFGMEYRREELNSVTDTAFATGDGAGQGGPTIGLNGANDNYDLFLEAQIPLIEGYSWADQASIDLAYRYSDYELGGENSTYKIGADYAPVPSFRLRASYQSATRAPNIIELFQAQGLNLFDMDFDPCDDTRTPAVNDIPTACIGTGGHQVSDAQADSGVLQSPAGQYNFLQGGNTALNPEEATTWTVGFVFQPEFLPGFNMSLDWFQIEIQDLVDVVDPLSTINACYNYDSASACSLITRDPGTGSLWLGGAQVVGTNVNIGGLETSGIDISANYGVDLADWGMADYGGLNFSFVGTWLDELTKDEGTALPNSVYDCAGYYGNFCGVPNPEWRHRFRVSWESPWAFEVSGTWRYYGEVEFDQPVANPTGILEMTFDPTGRLDGVFDAENYFDIAASWQVRDTTRLRAGVNNVLDNDPPLSYSVGTTGNNNTYPQLYDSMGRYFFFGITQDF